MAQQTYTPTTTYTMEPVDIKGQMPATTMPLLLIATIIAAIVYLTHKG